MTRKEMAQVLAIVRTAYPNTKIENPEAMLSAWMMCLGEFSAESVMKAARLHLNTSKFFPTPSEIRDKMVRASIVYVSTEIDADGLEQGDVKLIGDAQQEEWTDERLEELCRFVGLGYPNEIEKD